MAQIYSYLDLSNVIVSSHITHKHHFDYSAMPVNIIIILSSVILIVKTIQPLNQHHVSVF